MSLLHDWAGRHQVDPTAMAELFHLLGYTPETPQELAPHDEAYVQSVVRLNSAMYAYQLGRNNRGALPNEHGVPIRFGWLNDTPALDKVCKTGDLIGYQSGWFRDFETFEPIKLAVFVMLECKKGSWKGYRATDKREAAQMRAIEMVLAAGGIAAFTTGELPPGVRFPALTNEAPV